MDSDHARGPVLLTPGPVTTSSATKRAMLRDYGLNEPAFLDITAEVRALLVAMAGGGDAYTAVLLQGTGNGANEATLGTLVPRDGRLLVVSNGFYGERLKRIAGDIGLGVVPLDFPFTEPVAPEAVDHALAADPAIGHVVACHVDTGTGILNPIEAIAEVVRARRRALIVDAVASFGGYPLDAPALGADALVVSANKWLEGVPGLALVVARKAALAAAEGRAHSHCLDLVKQWQSFETSGRWRFTPPVQPTAALHAALRQHAEEGRARRFERIATNRRILVDGLRRLGFETVIPDAIAAPVIATFHAPADPRYDRDAFFDAMHRRGFVMFRGQLIATPSFRIGCMGAIDGTVMERVVGAVDAAMDEMAVSDRRPAAQMAAAE